MQNRDKSVYFSLPALSLLWGEQNLVLPRTSAAVSVFSGWPRSHQLQHCSHMLRNQHDEALGYSQTIYYASLSFLSPLVSQCKSAQFPPNQGWNFTPEAISSPWSMVGTHSSSSSQTLSQGPVLISLASQEGKSNSLKAGGMSSQLTQITSFELHELCLQSSRTTSGWGLKQGYNTWTPCLKKINNLYPFIILCLTSGRLGG